jgi:DNA-binding NarL/FixJ family response regulator
MTTPREPGHPAEPAKILVVDDHPVVRDGLAALVATQPDLRMCGEAADLTDALALVVDTRPDVAVIDILLKSGSGLDLIKRLTARHPSARIVVWSMCEEELYAERALRAGAVGYVHKASPTREILHAVRAVLAGKVYLSEAVSAKLLGRFIGGGGVGPANRSPIETLSDRELEVFEQIGRGRTTDQIAAGMHLSPKTVETYRSRIKEKLGVGSFTELIQRATQWVLEKGYHPPRPDPATTGGTGRTSTGPPDRRR